MRYPHYNELYHNLAYAKHLFDYLTNQQQLCKSDAVFQIAEEMGIPCLDTIYRWVNIDCC